METKIITTEAITLKKTTGKELIGESKIFSWIDSDFKNYGCNVKEKPKKAVDVEVREMTENGTFKDIFAGDLDKLVLSQGQILEFVKNHKDLLSKHWYTFFLFKVDGEYFVARVLFRGGGGLLVGVRRFSRDGVWFAERRHRMVVPKLILENSGPRSSDALTLLVQQLEKTLAAIKEALNK